MNEDNIKVSCKFINVDLPSRNGRIYSKENLLQPETPIYQEISKLDPNIIPIYEIPRGNTRKFSVRDYIIHKYIMNMYEVFTYPDICNLDKYIKELYIDEYRKFIKDNKYKGIRFRNGQISIPRIQYTKSNGNNIKYDS